MKERLSITGNAPNGSRPNNFEKPILLFMSLCSGFWPEIPKGKLFDTCILQDPQNVDQNSRNLNIFSAVLYKPVLSLCLVLHQYPKRHIRVFISQSRRTMFGLRNSMDLTIFVKISTLSSCRSNLHRTNQIELFRQPGHNNFILTKSPTFTDPLKLPRW